MMCYKDKTFCASAGICANTTCPVWFDFDKSKEQDLPVALADFKSDSCGYKPKPVYADLLKAVKGEQ